MQCKLYARILLRKFFYSTNAYPSPPSSVIAVEEQVSQSPCPPNNLEEKGKSMQAHKLGGTGCRNHLGRANSDTQVD